MTNFALTLSLLIALWIPLLQLYAVTRKNDVAEWISYDALARIVVYSRRVSDRVFGKRIISFRAFLVSFIFSNIYVLLSLSIAY